MIATLDACVLFPTVMRETLIGAAEAGLFTPVWSERILTEWTRAAARLGPVDADIARAEAALLRDRHEAALFPDDERPAMGFDLPDLADLHVLATALVSQSDQIVTLNLRDFPRHVMERAGLRAIHPDAFLIGLHADYPRAILDVARQVHATALSRGIEMDARALFKRARLPRLGRAVAVGIEAAPDG